MTDAEIDKVVGKALRSVCDTVQHGRGRFTVIVRLGEESSMRMFFSGIDMGRRSAVVRAKALREALALAAVPKEAKCVVEVSEDRSGTLEEVDRIVASFPVGCAA